MNMRQGSPAQNAGGAWFYALEAYYTTQRFGGACYNTPPGEEGEDDPTCTAYAAMGYCEHTYFRMVRRRSLLKENRPSWRRRRHGSPAPPQPPRREGEAPASRRLLSTPRRSHVAMQLAL